MFRRFYQLTLLIYNKKLLRVIPITNEQKILGYVIHIAVFIGINNNSSFKFVMEREVHVAVLRSNFFVWNTVLVIYIKYIDNASATEFFIGVDVAGKINTGRTQIFEVWFNGHWNVAKNDAYG